MSRQLLSSHARVHRIKKIKVKKRSFLLLVLFDVESSEHAIKLWVPEPLGSLLTSLKTISF